MSCCSGKSVADISAVDHSRMQKRERFSNAGHPLDENLTKYVFSLPTIHCGACIATIEQAMRKLDGVKSARVNLTLKRLNLELSNKNDVLDCVETIEKLGFDIHPVDIGDLEALENDKKANALLKALAVAGFAAANIMLLSVSVWSGADGPTRDLFHLISGLIAVPVVLYSGRTFYRSALGALKAGRLNMDVPISLAVLLALGMSIFETMNSGEDAYFDATVTLLFFLLIGRYLDQNMRDKARQSVVTLSKMAMKGANRILDNGDLDYTPIDEIKLGMRLRVFPGDRIPIDGVTVRGTSDVDCSIATGESEPVAITKGSQVIAGSLNLTGAIDLKVEKLASESFLSEILDMLEAAENGRGSYVRIADRMAQIYAPAVHLLALIAFIAWMFITSGDVHHSLTIAIAVLIVTCPCALGLAVPVVHVVGASRLFQSGILMRDGSALERLADIDHALFDKTGTLTMGVPIIERISNIDPADKPILKALAAHSSHPASKAIAKFLHHVNAVTVDDLKEVPGFGVQARYKGQVARLGRASWARGIVKHGRQDHATSLQFTIEGKTPVAIHLNETMRPDAKNALGLLAKMNIPSEILSGDGQDAVDNIANALGVDQTHFGQTPHDKLQYLEQAKTKGRKIMMVGDGINDAPCLAASHVSLAPASAADVGRQAADFVFTGESLSAVPFAVKIARHAKKIVQQNFALALLYNVFAVSFAMAGYVTPLVAAIAMSSSSILVVSNSLRLYRLQPDDSPKHKTNQKVISITKNSNDIKPIAIAQNEGT